MGAQSFPIQAINNFVYSTYLPINASKVFTDGQLVASSGIYRTTITGNGGIAYLTSPKNPVTMTLSGSTINATYTLTSGVITPTATFSGITNVTINASLNQIPSAFVSSTLSSSRPWTNIAYGSGTYVATSALTGTTQSGAYSTNSGQTWTGVNIPIGQNADNYGMPITTNGSGTFVALGISTTSGAISTNNGQTWSTTTIPNNSYASMAYGNGYYIGIVYNGGIYSTNGTTWTSFLFSTAGGVTLNAGSKIVYTPSYSAAGTFVVVQAGYGQAAAAYASAPGTWYAGGTLINSANINWLGIAVSSGTLGGSNSTFVAVGASGVGGATTLATGAYLSNANPTGNSAWNTMTLPAKKVWTNIAYSNGYFVAISVDASRPSSGTTSAYSPDGITWTASTMPTTASWCEIAAGSGSSFVAVGGYYSSNQVSAYFVPYPNLPATYGIYAGPTTIN